MGASPSCPQFQCSSTDIPLHGFRLKNIHEFIENCGGRGTLVGLTTAEVCEVFIKPYTAHHTSSLLDILREIQHPAYGAKADVFISHAWKYEFLSVMDSLLDHFSDNPDVIIWFDLFCNNQHKAVSLDYHWWATTFREAIASFKHTVMVMSPWNDPIPLTRAWCLFEMYCTISNPQCTFELLMQKQQSKEFVEAMKVEGIECVDNMLSTIDVRRSECFKEEDRVRIFASIERDISGGFDRLNALVFHHLRQWIVQSAITELNNQLTLTSDVMTHVNLKGILGNLYNHQGKFAEAESLFVDCLSICQDLCFRYDLLMNLARTKFHQRDYAKCREYIDECIVLAGTLSAGGSGWDEGNRLVILKHNRAIANRFKDPKMYRKDLENIYNSRDNFDLKTMAVVVNNAYKLNSGNIFALMEGKVNHNHPLYWQMKYNFSLQFSTSDPLRGIEILKSCLINCEVQFGESHPDYSNMNKLMAFYYGNYESQVNFAAIHEMAELYYHKHLYLEYKRMDIDIIARNDSIISELNSRKVFDISKCSHSTYFSRPQVLRRLAKEYKMYMTRYFDYLDMGIISFECISDEGHIFEVVITGPEFTAYHGMLFQIQMILPKEYPLKPPKCRFVNRDILHPSIGNYSDLKYQEMVEYSRHTFGGITYDLRDGNIDWLCQKDQYSPAFTMVDMAFCYRELLKYPIESLLSSGNGRLSLNDPDNMYKLMML